VLAALREHFVTAGPFGVTQDTEGVLEVEDRSGPGSWVVLVAIGIVTALFTFGVGTILLVLWAFTKIRRLRLEAASLDIASTRLIVAGYPQQVVVEAEQWIRANLPVEDASG
jgi:succinate dehydrogenase/fumarate reductase cytochrome b subunit